MFSIFTILPHKFHLYLIIIIIIIYWGLMKMKKLFAFFTLRFRFCLQIPILFKLKVGTRSCSKSRSLVRNKNSQRCRIYVSMVYCVLNNNTFKSFLKDHVSYFNYLFCPSLIGQLLMSLGIPRFSQVVKKAQLGSYRRGLVWYPVMFILLLRLQK